jgi:hypothetical protein
MCSLHVAAKQLQGRGKASATLRQRRGNVMAISQQCRGKSASKLEQTYLDIPGTSSPLDCNHMSFHSFILRHLGVLPFLAAW